MIDRDKMKVLVITTDDEGVTDVRDASTEEREHFFDGMPAQFDWENDPHLPFRGWGYVDEIYGPNMETIGYVVGNDHG